MATKETLEQWYHLADSTIKNGTVEFPALLYIKGKLLARLGMDSAKYDWVDFDALPESIKQVIDSTDIDEILWLLHADELKINDWDTEETNLSFREDNAVLLNNLGLGVKDPIKLHEAALEKFPLFETYYNMWYEALLSKDLSTALKMFNSAAGFLQQSKNNKQRTRLMWEQYFWLWKEFKESNDLYNSETCFRKVQGLFYKIQDNEEVNEEVNGWMFDRLHYMMYSGDAKEESRYVSLGTLLYLDRYSEKLTEDERNHLNSKIGSIYYDNGDYTNARIYYARLPETLELRAKWLRIIDSKIEKTVSSPPWEKKYTKLNLVPKSK